MLFITQNELSLYESMLNSKVFKLTRALRGVVNNNTTLNVERRQCCQFLFACFKRSNKSFSLTNLRTVFVGFVLIYMNNFCSQFWFHIIIISTFTSRSGSQLWQT